ncbi:unnamed protein product [Brassica rapa subsp. narinosa]
MNDTSDYFHLLISKTDTSDYFTWTNRDMTCSLTIKINNTTTAKRNTPETERRFTGPLRKLNGVSPVYAGSKRLPKLTTSSLLLFTGERQRGIIREHQPNKSRAHPSHEARNQPKHHSRTRENNKNRHRNARTVRRGEEAGETDSKGITFSRKQIRRSLTTASQKHNQRNGSDEPIEHQRKLHLISERREREVPISFRHHFPPSIS